MEKELIKFLLTGRVTFCSQRQITFLEDRFIETTARTQHDTKTTRDDSMAGPTAKQIEKTKDGTLTVNK